jgi:molybdopterin-containing oxidoreductase family membrane subunit
MANVPIIEPGHSLATVTDHISAIVLDQKPHPGWWIGFGIACAGVGVLAVSLTMVLAFGTGVWGLNNPIGWGFDITNMVWWIGIGHAGTLISAVLLLLNQPWRTSINRFAEAMTLFAVACAVFFPGFHMGRIWLAYWVTPIPNTMAIWPNFRSPLVWDVFAISTYGLVSLLFWYVGLIPDLATLRDRSKNRAAQIIYGILAMGWRGAANHWERYETAYGLLAGLATPLVVSVHTVVSFDFAAGVIPGWHATVFPPYFVAGAIYSGFAMVMTIAIPLRAAYRLEDFITDKHLDNMAKVMLATGMFVCYGYGMEAFMAWYGGNEYEWFMIENRILGPYAWAWWSLMTCNAVIPQVLWSKRVRSSSAILFVISIVVNIGMWLERFVIVVTSLHRDYMPSSWDMYSPTIWEFGMYFGTISLFTFFLFLFIRFLPMISIFEMRTIVPGQGGGGHH